MKTTAEVIAAFDRAALCAGLSRNTRKTYAATIAEFSDLLKAGRITGVQDYLDTAAARNVIPIRRPA